MKTNDMDPTLSVVIPIYNERETWRSVVDRVAGVATPGLEREIILVDDASTDGTREALVAWDQAPTVPRARVLFHEANRGKGAAVRTGFAATTGEFVIVQDADLEYDPVDYPNLLAPLLAGEADVVLGSRFAAGDNPQGHRANYAANRFLTGLSNLTTGLKLTDMETCYKVLRREVLMEVLPKLQQNRFGFEPEIVARLARLKARIVERPISYNPRSQAEGKKIGLRDGLSAIACIFRYGWFAR